ncbi:hypothetical protein BS47DRAFT_1394019 [Hydnum rufescens UP504]|uniref:Thioredoxin domain-containing protein n=1 Tax=Hydnum rufescens UP504 TaxID=1448309 RepID=A0A9P6DT01_9AGAM|nr:hypothetical protein BS47DRAFT_1394019 [Hydnum rufescens UP504]
MVARTLALSLALLPALASAGLFREGGPVKMLQDAAFRKTLKAEKTAVVAFVAPWCGNSPRLRSLSSPLIDFYAVDCDADENKRLCAEQGVKGFPTIKRKASSIVTWAGSEVPARVTNLKGPDAISKWATKESSQPRVLLLTTQPKIPVMWKVLGARYHKQIPFGAAKDEGASIAESLGLPAPASGENAKSRVVVWQKDEATPTVYEGKLKFEALSQYFETIAVIDSDAPHPKREL